MPFSAPRFNRLMALKNVTQTQLADTADMAQSQVSDCKKGICRTTDLTEAIAKALDCTPDFLLGWSFPGVDDDDALFRAAVASMAFDAFAKRDIGADQKDRCRKVLRHALAPLTADGWATLSEQIDLAIGSPPSGDLRLVRDGT